MLNSTDSIQDVVKLLRETKDPAEKAALIAELVLSELPDDIALIARKCVILHWFDQFTITALLQNDDLTHDEIRNVYEQIISLPFVEKLPWGFAIQNLTREGLIKRYISIQPDLLKSAAHLAARGYEVSDNEAIAAEALFCYEIAGDRISSKKLLDRLTERALRRGDTHYIENLQDLLKETAWFPFVDSSINQLNVLLISLNNLAGFYRAQGKDAQAEPFLTHALAIREKSLGPEHLDTAATLNNLVDAIIAQEDFATANQYLERAIQLLTELENHEQASVVLFDAGRKIYERLEKKEVPSIMQKQYNLARHYLERSLAIDEKLQDKGGIAANLRVLISVTIAEREYAAIDQHLERIIQLLIEQEDHRQASVVLFNTGKEIYEQLEQQHMTAEKQECLQQVQRYYERSLAIGRALLEESETATILEALIDVTMAEEDYVATDQYLERVVQLFTTQGDQKRASAILYSTGRRIYEQLKKREAAEQDEDKDESGEEAKTEAEK